MENLKLRRVLKLCIFVVLALSSLNASAYSEIKDDFNVSEVYVVHTLTSHEVVFTVQNLNSVSRDFGLGFLLTNTSFQKENVYDFSIYEKKTENMLVDNYSYTTIQANCTDEFNVTYECNQTVRVNNPYYANVVGWKLSKMNLVSHPDKVDATYGNINIPKFESKAKFDDFGNIETINGTKTFMVTWKTPYSCDSDGCGSYGEYAVFNNITGSVFHPYWNVSYPYKLEINCSNMFSGQVIIVNGSTGFTQLPNVAACSGTQLIWTKCSGTGMAIYYHNCSSLVIANDSEQIPFQCKVGYCDSASYLPGQVYNTSYKLVQHLNETTGTHYDSSTYGNNCTQSGGVNQSATGKINGADGFDGTNDYLNCGNGTSLKPLSVATMSFWIKPKSYQTTAAIWQIGFNYLQGFTFWQWAFGGVPSYYVLEMNMISSTRRTAIVSLTYVPLNEWTFITAIFNGSGGNISYYINGVYKGDATVLTGDITYVGNFRVGNLFNGTIDEVRILNIALNASEINNTYQNYIGTTGFGTLATTTEECTCNTCADCTNKLNNENCSTVYLSADITDYAGTCIDNPQNFTDKTFDCQGYTIDGNASSYGIKLYNQSNNTINNCSITEFYYGISLDLSVNNTISNSSVNKTYYGLAILSESDDNRVNYNTLNENYYGVYVSNSTGNLIENNTANNNYAGLFFLADSDGNIVNGNIFCDNIGKDINNTGSVNSGDNNTCNTTYNWNDTGSIGCSYACSDPVGTCQCDSCDVCELRLNDESCTIVKLNTSVSNYVGTCIDDPVNFSNKIFDCQGHTIDGDETGVDSGILTNGVGNTIDNCIIRDFRYGINDIFIESCTGFSDNCSEYLINGTQTGTGGLLYFSSDSYNISVDNSGNLNLTGDIVMKNTSTLYCDNFAPAPGSEIRIYDVNNVLRQHVTANETSLYDANSVLRQHITVNKTTFYDANGDLIVILGDPDRGYRNTWGGNPGNIINREQMFNYNTSGQAEFFIVQHDNGTTSGAGLTSRNNKGEGGTVGCVSSNFNVSGTELRSACGIAANTSGYIAFGNTQNTGFVFDFYLGEGYSYPNWTRVVNWTQADGFNINVGNFSLNNGSAQVYGNMTIDGNMTANDFCIDERLCLGDLNRVKLTSTDNQSIVDSGLWTNVTFNIIETDSGNDMFNASVDNYTVNIKQDGLYIISYNVKITSADKVQINTQVLRNGITLETSCDLVVGSKDLSFVTMNNYNMFNLSAGDNITLQVSHDNSGSLDLVGHHTSLIVSEIA